MTEQAQVEITIASFEAFLRHREFALVDACLRTMDVDANSPAVLIGVLSITYHAKAELFDREVFLARVEASLTTRLGSERTKNLLEHRR